MDEVAEEVPFVIDGVVDAEQIFTHVGGNLARGRGQLIGDWLVAAGIFFSVVEEQRVGIQQECQEWCYPGTAGQASGQPLSTWH